jgi:hypothetical protein
MVGLFTLLLMSCGDKQLSKEVDRQGNEVAGVPQGQFHRPGKECVVCHQDGGEASDHPFTLAGTVFASTNRQVGVAAASILLTDSDGSKFIATTNCVGNFFVRPSDWQPKYPIIVDIQKGDVRRTMSGPIGRQTDCAFCHKQNIDDPLSEVDHIYLFGTDEPGLLDGDPTCPVDPVVPGTK